MGARNHQRRALVYADGYFLLDLLRSRVIDVGLIIDAHEDSVFVGEEMVWFAFAGDAVLLGLHYFWRFDYLFGQVEYFVVVAGSDGLDPVLQSE